MDTTDPHIEFDGDGICNHCNGFEYNIRPNWHSGDTGKPLLHDIIQKIKKYGSDKDYDCIIGLSGGVDSSYTAVKLKEFGLRPLAVHVDAGWNSELAVKNIEGIVDRLGIDLITHVIDWEEMKDLQLAFLRSNVANQDIPQDHAFTAALFYFAIKSGIRYVISGNNYATESVMPRAWVYNAMDRRHITGIHKKFGKKKLKTFPTIGFFNYYFYFPYVKRLEIISPLNYLPYVKYDTIKYLEENYGWQYYGGKHYESRWTRFFQSYYLPVKFGYDKRKAHLSSLILSGQITRDQALEELSKPVYELSKLADDLSYISKKLGISVSELEELIMQPPADYAEYPNNERLYFTLWRLKGRLRGILNSATRKAINI